MCKSHFGVRSEVHMVHAEFSEDLHPKMRISRPFVADAHAALRLKELCLEPPRLSQRSLGRDHAVSEHLSTSHKDGGVNVLFPTS